MNLTTKVPFARTSLGLIVSRLLHTKLGAKVGFFLGISGYNQIEAIIRRGNGEIEVLRSYNARTDSGAALIASLVAGSALGGITSPAAPKYMALSTSSLTPAKTDTTLTGETAATGLARAVASAGSYVAPSALDGGASYVFSKTFTNSSPGAVTIASAALFDAASVGNLYVEGNLSASATLQIGDDLTINWTINH